MGRHSWSYWLLVVVALLSFGFLIYWSKRGLQRQKERTEVRTYLIERAKKFGLVEEVLDTFEDYMETTDDPWEAAQHTVISWDI